MVSFDQNCTVSHFAHFFAIFIFNFFVPINSGNKIQQIVFYRLLDHMFNTTTKIRKHLLQTRIE